MSFVKQERDHRVSLPEDTTGKALTESAGNRWTVQRGVEASEWTDHEAGEVVEFAAHVGVEQGLVALAAAPKHVILATQGHGRIQRRLDLRAGMGHMPYGALPAHISEVAEVTFSTRRAAGSRPGVGR